jgi:hypothetical protein
LTRRYSASETSRRAKAKRDKALERGEFRAPSEARVAPSGATSFPIKAEDEAIRALIDAKLAAMAKGSVP